MSDKFDRGATEPCRPETCCAKEIDQPLINTLDQRTTGCGDKRTSNYSMYGDTAKAETGCREEKQITDCTQQFSCGKTAVEKLGALEKLAGLGASTFKAQDEHGQTRDYAIELEQVQGKMLIQCFSRDEQGNKRVVVRAVIKEDGKFDQQRNPDGDRVGYYGDWWAANMRNEDIGGKPAFVARVQPPRSEHHSEKGNDSRHSENHKSDRQPKHHAEVRQERGHHESHSKGRIANHDDGRRDHDERDDRRGSGQGSGFMNFLGRVAERVAPALVSGLMGGNSCHEGQWGRSSYDHQYEDQHRYQRHPQYQYSTSGNGCGSYYENRDNDYYQERHQSNSRFSGLLNFGRRNHQDNGKHKQNRQSKHCQS